MSFSSSAKLLSVTEAQPVAERRTVLQKSTSDKPSQILMSFCSPAPLIQTSPSHYNLMLHILHSIPDTSLIPASTLQLFQTCPLNELTIVHFV